MTRDCDNVLHHLDVRMRIPVEVGGFGTVRSQVAPTGVTVLKPSQLTKTHIMSLATREHFDSLPQVSSRGVAIGDSHIEWLAAPPDFRPAHNDTNEWQTWPASHERPNERADCSIITPGVESKRLLIMARRGGRNTKTQPHQTV